MTRLILTSVWPTRSYRYRVGQKSIPTAIIEAKASPRTTRLLGFIERTPSLGIEPVFPSPDLLSCAQIIQGARPPELRPHVRRGNLRGAHPGASRARNADIGLSPPQRTLFRPSGPCQTGCLTVREAKFRCSIRSRSASLIRSPLSASSATSARPICGARLLWLPREA